MTLKNLHKRLDDWDFGIGIREPATETEINLLEDIWQVKLPKEFKDFLLKTNGFDGSCGNWGFVVYNINEIVNFNKINIDVEFLPKNVVQFGGDGGGEIFLIDFRLNQPYFGFTSGIVGMDEFLKLGKDFYEFIENYYWTSLRGFDFGERINKEIIL